jgi:hypothetical protein
MPSYSLLDLTAQKRAIGRASVFYAPAAYAFAAGGTDLALTHLGDTEGEVTVDVAEEYSDLTLPELTGSAIHDRYAAGESPTVNLPLYVADSALRAILSPTGSASGGYMRRRKVTEYTLVIIPEEVFIEDNAQVPVVYTKTGGWQVGGNAATADQLALLDQSVFFWRGHFTRAMPIYRHEDGGKVVQQVQFQAMHNGSMPDGHKLFTVGRPDQKTPAIHISAT